MVIQDNNEAPLEMSVVKAPNSESKKYVIVKNHVREIPADNLKESPSVPTHTNSEEVEKTSKKSSKRSKVNNEVGSEQKADKTPSEISQADLEELRAIYNQCKSVLNRIESKYGHLLNLPESSLSSNRNETDFDEECHCSVNKKIIFDENGQQTVQETVLENHVCPKKLKRNHDHQQSTPSTSSGQNIALEYEEDTIQLPDDLKTLSNILQDPKIDISYRNKVIDKVKMLKMENQNEIRFNRPAIIEQLKSNPESTDIFEFKGANLYTLPGYPTGKK